MEGEPTLIARTMESMTVHNQLDNARFYGHADHDPERDQLRFGPIAISQRRSVVDIKLAVSRSLCPNTSFTGPTDASSVGGIRLVQVPYYSYTCTADERDRPGSKECFKIELVRHHP